MTADRIGPGSDQRAHGDSYSKVMERSDVPIQEYIVSCSHWREESTEIKEPGTWE